MSGTPSRAAGWSGLLPVDKPAGPKNYVETSCSIMFSYALAKGAQRGWIGPEYMEAARRGMRGVLNREVDMRADGKVDIRGTVTVGSSAWRSTGE